jgi:hypothetical protein
LNLRPLDPQSSALPSCATARGLRSTSVSHEGRLYYATAVRPEAEALRETWRVPRWVCPRCDREFGRAGQSHVCVPGITPEELLSRHPGWVGEIYAAVIEHLRSLGPIHEDAVNVGIFLLSDHKLAEFRPRVRSVQLALCLPDRIESPRVSRIMRSGTDRFWHLIKLTGASQVDGELREWLDEAYLSNTE